MNTRTDNEAMQGHTELTLECLSGGTLTYVLKLQTALEEHLTKLKRQSPGRNWRTSGASSRPRRNSFNPITATGVQETAAILLQHVS